MAKSWYIDWHKTVEFIYRYVLSFVFGALIAEMFSYSFGLGDWADALFRNRLVGFLFVLGVGLIGTLYRRSIKKTA